VGTKYWEFNEAGLGGNGQVLFGGHVGSQFNTEDTLWLYSNGTVTRIAKANTPAPGFPAGNLADLHFNASSGPYLSENGIITFRGVLTVTGAGGVTTENKWGIWTGTTSTLAPVIRTAIAIPNGGGTYPTLTELTANPDGDIAFQGVYSLENSSVVTRDSAGTVRVVARTNATAPGAGTRTFEADQASGGLKPFSSLALTGDGQVVFGARLNDGTHGIWTSTAAGLALVGLGSTQAPGTPTGAVFGKTTLGPGTSRQYYLSPSGNFGFIATLSQGTGGVVAGNQYGMWGRVGGTLTLLARQGDLVPGMDGVFFSRSTGTPFDTPTINDAGTVVFTGALQGTGITAANDTAIWTGQVGNYSYVVREGNTAPGAAGWMFTDFDDERPIINAQGSFVFDATLQSTTSSQTRDSLWAYDPTQGLILIGMQGDVMTVEPGVDLTVSSLGGSFDSALSPQRAIDDTGRILYRVTFTDGSQMLATAQVPEPSALALLGVCAMQAAIARKRRA
jgi:hypothetical protein